jgi:ankyrin repeat protein
MNQSHISDAINSNYCDIIQYVLSVDYDMQQIFNECDLKIIRIHLPMVKILVEHHIDISAKIDDILICGVKSDELELVTYCIENNYNCDINSALEYACQCGYLDIITYLLRMGADVSTIDVITINCNNIKLLKILVTYGYCIPVEYIDFIFSQCFTNINNDITDLLFLIEYKANPEFVFKWELDNYDYTDIGMIVDNPRHYHRVNSHLEFIVSMGYISRFRYLLEVNSDRLLLEVDRLFIVACANGQMDMVIYLLELGADINTELYMALNVACYFGHIDMVKFLLEKINLADITENLLMLVIHGWMSIIYAFNEKNTYAPYRKLRGTNNILRNDIYNYGIYHKDIFELLISKNINLTNLDILEILEMIPAYFFKLKFVSYIISIGFDINTVFNRDVLDFKQTTILELSVYIYDIDLVKYVINNGVNITISNDRLMKIVKPMHTPIEITNLLFTDTII